MYGYESLVAGSSISVNTSAASSRQERLSPNSYTFCDMLIRINSLARVIAGRYGVARQIHAITSSTSQTVFVETGALSVNDMVEEIRAVFGLNALQVASLVKVSRATLYNHIKDQERPKNLELYRKLYEAAVAVREVAPQGVGTGLKTILVDGRTLLGHLKIDYSDPDHLSAVAQKVVAKRGEKSSPSLIPVELQRKRLHGVSRHG